MCTGLVSLKYKTVTVLVYPLYRSKYFSKHVIMTRNHMEMVVISHVEYADHSGSFVDI